jgi:tetrahydromethanopterin S-methyltransferase subunit G
MYRMPTWTDERMDDFAKHTDQRFDEVERRIDRIEQRVDHGFTRLDQRLDDIYHMVQRTIFQLGVGLIVIVGLGLFGGHRYPLSVVGTLSGGAG